MATRKLPTRRQLDNLKAQRVGFANRYQLEKYRTKDAEYLERKDIYNEMWGKGKGPSYIRSPFSDFDLFLRGIDLEDDDNLKEFFDVFKEDKGKKWEIQFKTFMVPTGRAGTQDWMEY